MKTLYFHVGAAKTATTSIQMALSRHNRSLRALGIYYPETPSCKHPELSFYSSFDLFHSYPSYTNYLPNDPDACIDILSYFRRVSQDYIENFLSSDCHTLILTDELLPYYCNTLEKLQKLSTLFPSFLDIRFVYYTRPPADMYISLYSTLVKVNQTTIWPHQFTFPADTSLFSDWIVSPEMFDHSAFISNIKEVFGVSSISVFPFPSIVQSIQFASPVHHFFAFVGVGEILPVCERVANPRLDYISLFILSFLNCILRALPRYSLAHSFLAFLARSCVIPVLEPLSKLSFYSFPSGKVLLSRSSFNRLFS